MGESRTSSLGQEIGRLGSRPTIAVLPFVPGDGSGDRTLSDGITDDIIVELSRFREIWVIGRGSSFSYGAAGRQAGRAAAELGARYVLEGSVRRSGSVLRITGQLVDTELGAQVWSDRLDAAIDDILEVQADIARRVAGSVVPEVAQAEEQRAELLPLNDVRAYEMALRAGTMIQRGVMSHDVDVLSAGISLAADAAAADPTCQKAQYALAFGYCRRGTMGYIGADSMGDLDRAMGAALRLRDLDPRSHAAYAVIGHIDMRLLRHADSLANLSRANQLNPNDVTTLRWLSWEKANHGLAGEAQGHAELSLQLSPRDRFIDQSYWAMALAAYVAGSLDETIVYARRAIALNREYGGHYVLLAASLAETGQEAEAAEVSAHLLARFPGLLESRLAGRTYFVGTELPARYQAALRRAAGRGPREPAERPGRAGRASGGAEGVLSLREQEVLRLVAKGQSNGAIAAVLDLSEHTVKRHVANILMKLDLPTRAAAVAHASRTGLL